MAKKQNYEYIKEYIENLGYELLSKEYINNQKPLRLRCQHNHEFEISFNHFQQSKIEKCPYCIGTKFTYEYVKDYIESFNYILLSDIYLNANENIEVMCDKGHIYNTTFSRFKCQNQRCPYCKGTIKYTYEEVKNYIESFGYKLLSTEYNNARERLLVKCECGNEYFVSFTKFKTGSRCYECRKVKWSKEKIIEYITNHTDFEFIEFIEYKKGISTLKLKCEHGHEFISNFNRVKYKGCGCPECKTSKGEQRIEEILIKYNLEYKKQHRFQDCRFKYPLPFDFYLPKQNCCIEYDGEQHYVAIDHFGGYEKLLETKRNDEIKNQYCKDNNINLIRIPYLEFDNIENILINKLK